MTDSNIHESLTLLVMAKTGFCAFNEKFRSFAIIKKASSYEQKVMAGTLGAVIKEPIGISSMLGI